MDALFPDQMFWDHPVQHILREEVPLFSKAEMLQAKKTKYGNARGLDGISVEALNHVVKV